jgi:ornithine carbamoyltransferase
LQINLLKKSFLSLKDFSADELNYLIDLAIKLKDEKKNNIYKYRLKNKNIAMIFEKTSTRTRCATAVACFDEGAHAEFLGKNEIQLGKKESVADTARVLGRMFDAIIFRGYNQETVKKLSIYSKIPVINGLTDTEHPTQILADFMTIKEYFGKLQGIKLAFLGDGNNNVANSLITGASKIGLSISIASPKYLKPDKKLIDDLLKENPSFANNIQLTDDPYIAVKDADVIYTDVWLSMGEEKKKNAKKKLKDLKKYKVDTKIMEATGKANSIFLHCLPASHEYEKHNLEVTEEVFESKQSFVFDQAENRMHTIKAILISLIGDNNENT